EATDHCGVEIHRRDAIGELEIEGVDVAGSAGQQNEDAILGFVLRGDARLRAGVLAFGCLPDQIGADYARPEDLEEPPPREVRAVEERQVRMRMAFHELTEFIL